jgi:hypothetical protein
MLKRLLCRLFRHKMKLPDDLSQLQVIRCLRCKAVLSTISADPEIPANLLADMSFTNGCMNKTRFASHEQAKNRMARMKSRPATLHPYFCHHCKGFHLGNTKKRWK